MRAWQHEVVAQVAGVTLPLLTLSAACLGTQLTLSSDNLPFGTVVLGSEVNTHRTSHCPQALPATLGSHCTASQFCRPYVANQSMFVGFVMVRLDPASGSLRDKITMIC